MTTFRASDAQVHRIKNTLADLKLTDSELFEQLRVEFNAAWASRQFDVPAASAAISRLDRLVRERDDRLRAVPAGFYAMPAAPGHLSFYEVRHIEPGRVLVAALGPDERHWLSRARTTVLLARIADVGVEVAAKRYADEIGRCFTCNRTLTDEESRARGQGPVCAGRNA